MRKWRGHHVRGFFFSLKIVTSSNCVLCYTCFILKCGGLKTSFSRANGSEVNVGGRNLKELIFKCSNTRRGGGVEVSNLSTHKHEICLDTYQLFNLASQRNINDV